MNIGIDITALTIPYPCGTKNYAINLIKNLAKFDKKNSYYLFAFQKTQIPQQKNFKFVVINSRIPIFKRQVILPLIAKRYNLELFHFLEPRASLFMTFVVKKIITTIHDTSSSGTFPWSGKTLVNRLFAEIYRFVSYKISTHFIAISEFTRKEMINLKNIKAEQITHVPYGLNPGFRRNTARNKNYYLTIGDFSPRKNLTKTLKAYSVLPHSLIKKNKLKIVISDKQPVRELMNLAARLEIKNRVEIIVGASQKQMSKLYRGAICFLYPSLYEGFGMPILESMASGCPVITSNYGAMKEIAGNASLFVNPKKISEIASAIETLTKDNKHRERLIKKGLTNIKKYRWRKNANETISLYKRILG